MELAADPDRGLFEATMMRRPNLSTGPASVDQARFSIDGLLVACGGVLAALALLCTLANSEWMTVLLALTMAAAAAGS